MPADFELHDPAAKRKKSAFRTLTMTMERPFSPLLGNENKPSGLRRAQSVRDMSSSAAAPAVPVKPAEEKPKAPIYSVVQERPKTPAIKADVQKTQAKVESRKEQDAPTKTPRKSKSRLLRLFGS